MTDHHALAQSGPPNRGIGLRERMLAEVGIVAVCGVLLALIGFSPALEAPLGTQMAIGIGGCLGGWAIMRGLAVIGTASARMLGWDDLWGYAFAIPVGSALITWAALWLTGGTGDAFGPAFAFAWPLSMLIAVGFFALFFLVYRRDERRAESEMSAQSGDSAGDGAPGLYETAMHDRLPKGFPRIIAMTAEDHYVKVIGDGRSEMVLMSLSDPPILSCSPNMSSWVMTVLSRSSLRPFPILIGREGPPVARWIVPPLVDTSPSAAIDLTRLEVTFCLVRSEL